MERRKYTLDDLVQQIIQRPDSKQYPNLLIYRLLKLEESVPVRPDNRNRNAVLTLYNEVLKDGKELTLDLVNQIKTVKLFSKIADAVHYNRVLKYYVGRETDEAILSNLVRLKEITYGQALFFWEQLFLEVESKFYVQCDVVLANIYNSMNETTKPEVTIQHKYIIKQMNVSEEDTRKSFSELADMLNDALFYKFDQKQLEYIKKADFGY